jgi:hypothetical protein
MCNKCKRGGSAGVMALMEAAMCACLYVCVCVCVLSHEACTKEGIKALTTSCITAAVQHEHTIVPKTPLNPQTRG